MTKHIDIRYHFLKDNIQKGHIELHFVPTDEETAEMFTKALEESKFIHFLGRLGMVNPESLCIRRVFFKFFLKKTPKIFYSFALFFINEKSKKISLSFLHYIRETTKIFFFLLFFCTLTKRKYQKTKYFNFTFVREIQVVITTMQMNRVSCSVL